MQYTLCILALCNVVFIVARNRSEPMTPSQVQRTLLRRYNRADLPPDGPTYVEMGVYVHSFYDVNERFMDYSMGIYFRQQWKDSRLAFDHFYNGTKSRRLKLEDGSWNKVWVPDIFFRNEKRAEFHQVTTPNRLIFLRSNGKVWYVTRLSLSLSCPMLLQRFPLDTQECPMIFESYGYSEEDITLGWLPQPVSFSSDIHMPRFTLLNFTLTDCTKNYTSGTYPCLKLDFILKRDVGYYLIQLYLPSALVVILSWIAFWSSTHAGLERISIGLLAVLTVTTHSATSRDHLPEVSYITAMDLWMSVCLLFGVASLLESAAVNAIVGEEYVSRRQRRLKRLLEREENITLSQLKPDENGERRSRDDINTRIRDFVFSGDEKAKRIDRVSRIAFPLAFVLFCVLYWVFYVFL